MCKRYLISGSLFFITFVFSIHAEEQSHRQHGAHVHGVADLLIVMEANQLDIEFISPAANIVGFEHAPSSMEQHTLTNDALQLLKQTDTLLTLPQAAGCKVTHAEISTTLLTPHDEHQHETHQHVEQRDVSESEAQNGHAEFHVHYRFQCAKPSELTTMTLKVFSHFPATHAVHVQTISSQGQHQIQSDADHPQISF